MGGEPSGALTAFTKRNPRHGLSVATLATLGSQPPESRAQVPPVSCGFEGRHLYHFVFRPP